MNQTKTNAIVQKHSIRVRNLEGQLERHSRDEDVFCHLQFFMVHHSVEGSLQHHGARRDNGYKDHAPVQIGDKS